MWCATTRRSAPKLPRVIRSGPNTGEGKIGDNIIREFIYPILGEFIYLITGAKRSETPQCFLHRRAPEVPYDETQKKCTAPHGIYMQRQQDRRNQRYPSRMFES